MNKRIKQLEILLLVVFLLIVCVITTYRLTREATLNDSVKAGVIVWGETYALVQFNGTDAEVIMLDNARQLAEEIKADIAEGEQK